jgi:hypothetical protein
VRLFELAGVHFFTAARSLRFRALGIDASSARRAFRFGNGCGTGSVAGATHFFSGGSGGT